MAGPNQGLTQVVFLISTHSISGQIDLGERRLSDWLNVTSETMIHLQDAWISRLGDPRKVLARAPSMIVRRQCILAAFEVTQKTGPSANRFYKYVKKQSHKVFILVDGMEITGYVHTLSSLDLAALTAPHAERFLPITDARATLVVTDRYAIEQKALLVSVEQIKSISAMPDEPSAKAATESARAAS